VWSPTSGQLLAIPKEPLNRAEIKTLPLFRWEFQNVLYTLLWLWGEFQNSPLLGGQFRTQVETCHRSFMSNDSTIKLFPCLGESFKLSPMIGESLKLSPDAWLSPNLGDHPSNAVLFKRATLQRNVWKIGLDSHGPASPWLVQLVGKQCEKSSTWSLHFHPSKIWHLCCTLHTKRLSQTVPTTEDKNLPVWKKAHKISSWMALVTEALGKLSWCEKEAVLVSQKKWQTCNEQCLIWRSGRRGSWHLNEGVPCASEGTCHLFFKQTF